SRIESLQKNKKLDNQLMNSWTRKILSQSENKNCSNSLLQAVDDYLEEKSKDTINIIYTHTKKDDDNS
ncbi:hypothetical protein DNF44_18400, partial [Salmonella enterica]|nr:hypothetical protein [Salmonella enterica]